MNDKKKPPIDLSGMFFDSQQFKYGILNNNLSKEPPLGGYPIPKSIEETKDFVTDWEKLLKEWSKGKK